MKDLNLIPKSYILAKRQKKTKLLMTASLLAVGVVIIVAVALPFGYKYILKKRSDSVNAMVVKGRESVEILSQLNTVKALYKQLDDEGSKLSIYGAKTTKLFEKIEKIVPMEFFITNMTISNKTGNEFEVTMSCISGSEDTTATFVRYLRNDRSFDNIVISSIGKTRVTSTPVIIKNTNEKNVATTKMYFSFGVNFTFKTGM